MTLYVCPECFEDLGEDLEHLSRCPNCGLICEDVHEFPDPEDDEGWILMPLENE